MSFQSALKDILIDDPNVCSTNKTNSATFDALEVKLSSNKDYVAFININNTTRLRKLNSTHLYVKSNQYLFQKTKHLKNMLARCYHSSIFSY
jgi:hypothetical protein